MFSMKHGVNAIKTDFQRVLTRIKRIKKKKRSLHLIVIYSLDDVTINNVSRETITADSVKIKNVSRETITGDSVKIKNVSRETLK